MARGKSKATVSKPKSSQSRPTKEHEPTYSPTIAPLELQQKCLNIFRDALRPTAEDADTLQEIKGHLFNRDFTRAFGKEEFLRVYASRWSPSRALGYLKILMDIDDMIAGHVCDAKPALRTVCLGGGAGAEIVALGGYLSQQSRLGGLRTTLVDIAAWDTISAKLHESITTPPELSKYASAAARASNSALLSEEAYTVRFLQRDALQVEDEQRQEIFHDADLVTLMFTLNELYSASMQKTQQMLTDLTAALKPGAQLLVVDSPGSYSTVSINGTEKRYPMRWLLDYTLVDSAQQSGHEPKWEKMLADDSRWFRLPQGLKYPIELENMRYQIHLYRRLEDVEND